MSDVLFLYLWTRLDAISLVAGMVMLITGLMYLLTLLLGPIWIRDFSDDSDGAYELRSKGLKILASILIPATILGVFLPSKSDMAIIVGGKVAIDAARSPEAQEIASDVMAVIKKHLKDSAK